MRQVRDQPNLDYDAVPDPVCNRKEDPDVLILGTGETELIPGRMSREILRKSLNCLMKENTIKRPSMTEGKSFNSGLLGSGRVPAHRQGRALRG